MALPTPPPSALSEATDDDLCSLADLNAESLLSLLETRFDRGAIFTWAGPVLLSLNPFASIERLFDEPYAFHEAWVGRASEDLPPHVFALAERAWRRLLAEPHSQQTFIVNGESGAGKTEACRQLMRYIADASLSRRRSASIASGEPPGALHATLEESMLQTSRVLEAFGNAKTIRNRNSSRFGKLTWLDFSVERALMGTQIQVSLLEKSRLVLQGADERNFHIFYQLCAAAMAEVGVEAAAGDAPLAALGPPTSWSMLCAGGCVDIAGVDDGAEFRTLCGALRAAGFSAAELASLWTLLGGLLHAGELRFAGEGGAVRGAVLEGARAHLTSAADAFSRRRSERIIGRSQHSHRCRQPELAPWHFR